MLTKIEKLMILIDLLNELPNVEYKMKGFSIRGMDNISKSKIIASYSVETLLSLLSLPPMTEKPINEDVSLFHYSVFDKQIFALKRKSDETKNKI